MPRPRFAKLPPERRAEILDVAARHFAAAGFAGASLNRILDEAGVSKGAAYYYFDDKGDLFATVVEQAWDEAVALLWPGGFRVDDLFAGDFWGALEDLYLRQVALFGTRTAAWRVAKSVPSVLDDPSAARLGPRIDALMAQVADALGRARDRGLVRDDLPLDLSMAMLGGLDAAIDGWLIDHADALRDDPDLARRTFAALRRLLEGGGRG